MIIFTVFSLAIYNPCSIIQRRYYGAKKTVEVILRYYSVILAPVSVVSVRFPVRVENGVESCDVFQVIYCTVITIILFFCTPRVIYCTIVYCIESILSILRSDFYNIEVCFTEDMPMSEL